MKVENESVSKIDGRRRRTLDSRARIVAAMLELAQQGTLSARAEKVAERANVGLRTVFRHFKDMDSLYREMSLTIERRLREEISLEFSSPHWRGRLGEMIQRRASLFERIAPFKRAEAAHRNESRWLEQDIARVNFMAREVLKVVVPGSVVADETLFEALDAVLGFEMWDRLRREQGLSLPRTIEVLRLVSERLLAGVED